MVENLSCKFFAHNVNKLHVSRTIADRKSLHCAISGFNNMTNEAEMASCLFTSLTSFCKNSMAHNRNFHEYDFESVKRVAASLMVSGYDLFFLLLFVLLQTLPAFLGTAPTAPLSNSVLFLYCCFPAVAPEVVAVERQGF